MAAEHDEESITNVMEKYKIGTVNSQVLAKRLTML
jgi:hypothetical protein